MESWEFFSNLTTKAGECSRAGRSLGTLAAGWPVGVHLSADVVAAGPVVAGVELGEPLALAELGEAAAHAVRVGPHHSRVVADGRAEPVTE